MAKTTATQCRLRKGEQEQVTWLPTGYATLGEYVRLGDDDGWQVIEVGTTLDSKFVNERSRDHKNMRKMTDI